MQNIFIIQDSEGPIGIAFDDEKKAANYCTVRNVAIEKYRALTKLYPFEAPDPPQLPPRPTLPPEIQARVTAGTFDMDCEAKWQLILAMWRKRCARIEAVVQKKAEQNNARREAAIRKAIRLVKPKELQEALLDLHTSYAKDEVHFSRITLR